jgi:hypothetical protein
VACFGYGLAADDAVPDAMVMALRRLAELHALAAVGRGCGRRPQCVPHAVRVAPPTLERDVGGVSDVRLTILADGQGSFRRQPGPSPTTKWPRAGSLGGGGGILVS